jgi:hypothetical protein
MIEKRLGLIVVCLFFLSALIAAQDTLQTGSIRGTATDSEGNPLPGVSVTIRSEALIKGTQSAVTTGSGSYRFVFLPVGTYEVTFELQGFKTLIKEGVKVSLRKTTTINAALEMSPIEETVTVTGEAPVVDTKSTTIGTNFSLEMLQKIPSARDPWVLMEMTPGMVMDRQNVGGSWSGQQSDGSAHGGLENQTGYHIDGVNMTDPSDLGSMMYYDFDSFEEIQIETGSHQADIQVSGVVVNMITKSGGNKFRGGISGYYEDEWLQSDNIPEDDPDYEDVGSGNPLDYLYDYGFDLGGPIIKDKLWFYGAFRRTEISRYIIGYELDGVPQTDYFDLWHGTFKLTWQIADNNKLMGWVNFDKKARPNRSAGPTRSPETTELQDSTSPFFHLEDTWTLSPDLLLNFKLGICDMWYQREPQPEVDMNKPAIRIYYSSPRRQYQDAYYVYRWYYHNRYQLNAFADYFKDDFLGGDHELKVGFEYQNSPYHTTRKHPANHLLYWDYPDRTGPWEVWTFREEKWDQTNEVYSAYIQDTFTLKKHLTFNLGLRFDRTLCHVNETTVPGNQWTDYYEQRTGEPVTLYAPAKKNVIKWNVFSPRLGLTFDLFNDGNNIFKASFARYSHQIGYYPAEYAVETGYWEVDYRWYDDNDDGMPTPDEFGSITYISIGEAYNFDPDMKSPYTDEAIVGFERKITNNLGLSLNFICRENKRYLWTDNLEIDPERDYAPLTVQDPGHDGEYGTADDGGNITVYDLDEDKVGAYDPYITNRPGYKTFYKGVEFVLNKRYANRWQLMAAVTIGSSKRKIPLEAVNDPNNREFDDDTPTGVDAPLIIKVSGSYELPLGFTIAGFFNYRSGYPTQRYFYYRGLNQGGIDVDVEKYGSERYPNLAILDLRLSKIFKMGKYGSVEAIVDVFNTFNAVTTLDWDAESWSGFHDIYEVLGPRIVRLGIKWNF